jgi:hypothetical protein
MKSKIIEELGLVDILPRSLIAEGLAANNRIKVRMSTPPCRCGDGHVEIARRVPTRRIRFRIPSVRSTPDAA